MKPTQPELLLQTAKLIPLAKRLHPTAGAAAAYCKEIPGTGSLMIVIEVLGPPKKSEELIDLVVNTLETNYFSKKSDKDSAGESEFKFEKATRELNSKLSKQSTNGNWQGKISAVIAVFEEGNLYVTSTGAAEAYLLRGQRHTSITSGLTGSEESDNLFSNIAGGNLQIGDQLAIVTPALLHQISLTELKSVVNNLTPSSAVAKLAQLLENQSSNSRTAALIAVATTPGLLAMNVRSNEPDEVTISQPLALPNISPAIKKANRTATSLGQRTRVMGNRLRPLIQKSLGKIKPLLQEITGRLMPLNRNGKVGLVIFAVVTLVALFWGGMSLTQASNLSKMEKQYVSAYELAKSAEDKLQSNDKTGASNDLNQARKVLEDLSKSANKGSLEKRLQTLDRPVDDPTSVKGLLEVVSSKLDIIDNIVRLKTSQIYNFGADKQNKSPQFLEILGDKLIAVSKTNGDVTLLGQDGKLINSTTGKSEIGKVVGITANAADDGLFIMTEEPSLWLYNLSEKSYTKQEISLGSLVKGSSVGSYNGNIYVLTESGVFKHTPTLSGFSTPSPSIKFDNRDDLKPSSTLAVDGNIYIGGGGTKLERFIAGASTHKAKDIPDTFAKPQQIIPVDEDTILVLSGSEPRIGVIELTESALIYKNQIAFNDITKSSAFGYDQGILYIISEGKLLKAQIRL